MKGQRAVRVGERIRDVVSEVLLKKVKDPRVALCTVTHVRMTGDLKIARIYFSVIGGEEKRRETLKGLNSARGFIRREIGIGVALKTTPAIEFIWDDTFEEMERIRHLLRESGADDA